MSYSIYLIRFKDGDAAAMDAEVFEAVTAPHIAEREPLHHFIRLRASDGGKADVYASPEADGTMGDVMLTRFSGGAILDIVAETANALGAAVVLQDFVALVNDVEQLGHLAPDLRQQAIVGQISGDAIQTAIDQA